MPRIAAILLALGVLIAPPLARCDPLIFVPSDALANDILTSMLAEEVLRDATRAPAAAPLAAPAASSAATPTTTPAGSLTAKSALNAGDSVVMQLAAYYPADKRAEARRTFASLLQKFQSEMAPRLGIPPDDLAGAMAAFIAGNYMAYRNSDFPDAQFKPLMLQMRQTLARSSSFGAASSEARQASYQRLAILGMFMAGSQLALQQRPNAQTAANLRRAAKGYLEALLKTDADRLRLDAQGLHFR